MSAKPRYVFDTNVTISAALFEHSPPGQAFLAALSRGELVISAATFAELVEVLGRKKFDRYLTDAERQEFLVKLVRAAVVVDVAEEIRACRDPKDDKFLEVAVSGWATVIVTGDGDLLVLHPYRGIPILSPTQFLETIAAESGESHRDTDSP